MPKLTNKQLETLNKNMELRMEKKRRNKNNWTKNEGYTIKNVVKFAYGKKGA